MSRVEISRMGRWAVILMAGASLAACASLTTPSYPVHSGQIAAKAPAAKGPAGYKTGEPYQVGGIWYVPHEQPNYDETGIASWYGDAFNMKATANGEIFDMSQISAAHTTLPLPSLVEVTNLENGRKLVVRVNDRGPFVGNRIIDLSHAAARKLGYDQAGLAKVRVRYVGPAPLAGPEAGVRVASAGALTPRYPISRGATAAAATAITYGKAPTTAAKTPIDDEVHLATFKSPEAVGVTTLASLPAAKAASAGHAPLTGDALPPLRQSTAQRLDPADATQGFRIQAGAFSDPDNARRAAAQLAANGAATVEPFQKDGVTLYRVFLPGPSDEVEAYAVRDKVAAAGFADARVVKGF
ncbi:MAG: septal ring lytic transglycosylase RlpA family protein [Phenylobacterium sp.]